MSLPSRTLAVADLLVTAIGDYFTAHSINSTVSREYVPPLDDASFDAWITANTNMGVFVVPKELTNEIETRGSDNQDYSFVATFVEKPTQANVSTTTGRPTQAWVDIRVGAVESLTLELGDIRNELASGLYCVESRFTPYDPGVLWNNQAFFATWFVKYRESVDQ